LARARTELAADDPHRLRYAALELRDAMEALTYDRALAFKDDIPPEEYKTWQPRKLMAVLLEIDPSIGMTSTVAFGLEEEYGKLAPRENMKLLGTDVVFTLADLKATMTPLALTCTCPRWSKSSPGRCQIRRSYESAARSSLVSSRKF